MAKTVEGMSNASTRAGKRQIRGESTTLRRLWQGNGVRVGDSARQWPPGPDSAATGLNGCGWLAAGQGRKTAGQDVDRLVKCKESKWLSLVSGLAGVPCEAWIFRAMLRGSRLRPGRVRRADGSCGTSVGLESAADAGLHTVFALILLLRRENSSPRTAAIARCPR